MTTVADIEQANQVIASLRHLLSMRTEEVSNLTALLEKCTCDTRDLAAKLDELKQEGMHG